LVLSVAPSAPPSNVGDRSTALSKPLR